MVRKAAAVASALALVLGGGIAAAQEKLAKDVGGAAGGAAGTAAGAAVGGPVVGAVGGVVGGAAGKVAGGLVGALIPGGKNKDDKRKGEDKKGAEQAQPAPAPPRETATSTGYIIGPAPPLEIPPPR